MLILRQVNTGDSLTPWGSIYAQYPLLMYLATQLLTQEYSV